jgi:hypothetical protein
VIQAKVWKAPSTGLWEWELFSDTSQAALPGRWVDEDEACHEAMEEWTKKRPESYSTWLHHRGFPTREEAVKEALRARGDARALYEQHQADERARRDGEVLP